MPVVGYVYNYDRKGGYGFIRLENGAQAFLYTKAFHETIRGEDGNPAFGDKAFLPHGHRKPRKVYCELAPGTRGPLPETSKWTYAQEWEAIESAPASAS